MNPDDRDHYNDTPDWKRESAPNGWSALITIAFFLFILILFWVCNDMPLPH